MFGSERLPLAERYAALLATEGVVRGLIGPREVPRLWERHLINCAVVGEVLPRDASVCDIGSGAGLPGLVLAIARPDLAITLVEPLLRRTTFLDEVVEELHGQQSFDVVTSRAVAPLPKLLAWSMPLVGADGALVAMKGSRAGEEIEAAAAALKKFRCADPEVLEVGAGEPALLEPATTLVRVVRRQGGVRG